MIYADFTTSCQIYCHEQFYLTNKSFYDLIYLFQLQQNWKRLSSNQ